MRVITVPPVFNHVDKNPYPRHQTGPQLEDRAEQWFRNNEVRTKRLYLPIKWTAYQITDANYGKDGDAIKKLQSFCKTLPKNRDFFTVVQYDDGCLAEAPNCRTFAGGGVGTDPIPLTCERHPLQGLHKKYLVTFLGSISTHPIRKLMEDKLSKKDGFIVEHVQTAKTNMERFRSITEESCFVLCPRGYGRTSFRLYEALQLGSVPIYISDEHWLPFTKYINWNEFCLVLKPEQIDSIPAMVYDLMKSGKYEEMKKNTIAVYDKYFAYDSCFKTIKRMLEEEV